MKKLIIIALFALMMEFAATLGFFGTGGKTGDTSRILMRYIPK